MQETPAPPQPPGSKSSFPVWAIVLIVIAAVTVPSLGVLAGFAVYGFRKYRAAAKQAEARINVTLIARSASLAFQEETLDASGASSHRLCPSSSRSVPARPTLISGKKYLSSASDWQADASTNRGFACLRFSLSEPQYYMYSYEASGPGNVGDRIIVKAQGDLDGDGRLSTFRLDGTVTAPGVLSLSPSIFEDEPHE